MGSLSHGEILLRRKLARLLTRAGKVGKAVSVLKEWESRGWEPILFGGVVRDLVAFGGRHYPRDVDVVLGNATMEQVTSGLAADEYRFNRFGGLHLNISRWAFDVWPLEKTWAFTVDRSLSPSAEGLTRTTFLNVEAIAVTLNGASRIGKVYSNGFFEALENKCVDINYTANPFPELSAIRSIITACRLRYSLSARLAQYFVKTVQDTESVDLILAQQQHYGRVIFGEEDINHLVGYFTDALERDEQANVALPGKYNPQQLRLWTP